jgi:hypothetical protein
MISGGAGRSRFGWLQPNGPAMPWDSSFCLIIDLAE